MKKKDETVPPVAIVGIGLRLPAGISTPDDFWKLLVEKRDGRCRVPDTRYNVGAFYNGGKQGRQLVASDHGYFLEDVDLKRFDAGFFSMSRSEAESADPQQKLLLEVVWECMERAGQTNWRGKNIGCYVGVFGEDWHDNVSAESYASPFARINGSGDFVLSNRLSYEYDLQGPSMTIRTACSSSLVCLHEACQALYAGECSGAIVAGTSLIMSPSMTIAMSQQGALAPDGRCKTFDAEADGYARGEAVNAIYVKLLDDAIRDGDPIRAIIRSTATNSDGKTAGMSVPSAASQERMIRRAYDKAGITDLSQTPYFECHGTGTKTGDRIETTAISNTFGEKPLYIGSVKPNLGHAEGASGLNSLIKAVLALENNVIPPNINFNEPNPEVPFARGKLQVPTDNIPWPTDRSARVSINSFGIGGSNAHVIIDSVASLGISPLHHYKTNGTNGVYDKTSLDPHSRLVPNGLSNGLPNGTANGCHGNSINGYTNGHVKNGLYLLPMSANNTQSLEKSRQNIDKYLQLHPTSLEDVAYTLGTRRDHLQHRTFSIVKRSNVTVTTELSRKICPGLVDTVFVFTGQGAQWSHMARELITEVTSFRDDIRALDCSLQHLEDPPSWGIEDVLCSGEDDLINRPEYAQTLCTAIQVALVNLLRRSGVKPSASIGHSSGEIAGAYASGAITATEAIIISYYRGITAKQISRRGAMAAVGLSHEAAALVVTGNVTVACVNSPRSVTISGDVEDVENTLETIGTQDPTIFRRKLKVNTAYHSEHVKEVSEMYERLLSPHLKPGVCTVPFYSSVTGSRQTQTAALDKAYWRRNLESPVLFYQATKALLDDFDKNQLIFVEIGPHSALKGPISQIFQEQSDKVPIYLPTLTRGNNCMESFLRSIGQFYTCGKDIDFSYINPPGDILIDLPTYAWDHSVEFWNESRLSSGFRSMKHRHHELLGSICTVINDTEPIWRNVLDIIDVPWLKDHKVLNDLVFPCAGYIGMIGEAIRQITGSEAYTIKNLFIQSALVLPETGSVELLTSMRLQRLTDTANSMWYEFSISSFNGTLWTQHCTALGRSANNVSTYNKSFHNLSRRVSKAYWYDRLRHWGLQYGPTFRGMDNITVDVEDTVARATIIDQQLIDGPCYPVHPITIDLCLQLYPAAMTNGLARRLTTLIVPSSIGVIHVFPSRGRQLNVETRAYVTSTGSRRGSSVAVSENQEAILIMEDGRMATLDTGANRTSSGNMSASQLLWRPEIDFVDMSSLMHSTKRPRDAWMVMEKACALHLLRTLDALMSIESDSEITPTYLVKYSSWLRKERARMAAGDWDVLCPEAKRFTSLDSETREALCTSVSQEMEELKDENVCKLTKTLTSLSDSAHVQDVFLGKTNPLEVLTRDGGLTAMYNMIRGRVTCEEFLSLCVHANPTLRILEIGAGTGATTQDVLDALQSDDGRPIYSHYCFTDISPGFFSAAKERFAGYSNMQYKVLDITKDPKEQGFETGYYDLVVASNVLHATPSLKDTLLNVEALLRPGGRLFLQELIEPMGWHFNNFIMGFLPGWWLGEDDGRPDGPFVSVERWERELQKAGFSGIDAAVLDDVSPYHINANIVATTVRLKSRSGNVTLLYKDTKAKFACDLADHLETIGFTTHWMQLHDQLVLPEQDIISTIELEEPFLHATKDADYDDLMEYITKLRSGMMWLTRSAQIECSNPEYGLTIGLARTIRSEMSLDFTTVELQALDHDSVRSVVSIFHKFQCRSQGENFSFEPEFVVHDGVVHIGRYYPISPEETRPESLDDGPTRLTVNQAGLIDLLEWVQYGQDVVQEDEVELEVCCVGLNFRDVLVSMGMVEEKHNRIGNEAAGIITRVGSAVRHVKKGDRVIAMDSGCLATRTVTLGYNVFPMPPELSFEDAATFPAVFGTVIHTIVNVGRLEKGESILIHSACGGVGLAAIQICRMIQAEIYVTVGTEEKKKFLVEHHDIPSDRIFYSRDESFLTDVMESTNGRGVDMVLNSLAGELLHASWQCVAKFGRMMEIGKRDIVGRGKLAMDQFEQNRAFHGIELRELRLHRPQKVQELMNQCMDYYKQGFIKPIRPVKVFPAERVKEAFHYMQKGQHIGKLIITMPKEATQLHTSTAGAAMRFSPTATYLIVGGMRGLGRAIANWMVEHGARSLVFLSRSAGQQADDQEFLAELGAQGCCAIASAGSVVELNDVKRAIELAPSRIAGVFQLSMVLKDLAIPSITHEDWQYVQEPKVKGTWNLHKALSDCDLEFFVLFSSQSAVYGQPGQAHYASANTFLASFAQYRHGLGLPCSVIDVGAVEGVGYVSQNAAILKQFRDFGVRFLQEQDLLDAVTLSISQSFPKTESQSSGSYRPIGHITTGMASETSVRDRCPWRNDIRLAFLHQLGSTEDSMAACNDAALRALLDSASVDFEILQEPESLSIVTAAIARALCGFTLYPEEEVDVTAPLSVMGIDSLVSIEIRNWWRRAFGTDITVLEIANGGSVQKLGIMALAGLQEKYSPKTKENTSKAIQSQTLGVDLNREFRHYMDSPWDLDNFIAQPVTTLPNQATVLLTGGSGYLGTEILRQLVRTEAIESIVVLVRAESESHGLQRIKEASLLAKRWTAGDEQKIEVWTGDISKPDLGLQAKQLARIRGLSTSHSNIDAVIHNGAAVSFNADFTALKACNVDSTIQLLKLAATSPASPKFVYISGGMKFDTEKNFVDIADDLTNYFGYSQTKVMSERIIHELAMNLQTEQNRLSAVKPGLIIGPADTGISNVDDALWNVVAAAAAMGIFPEEPETSWIHVSSVDAIAARIVQQLFTPDILSLDDIVDGMPLCKFWEIVAEELGVEYVSMPWEDWMKRATEEMDTVGKKHPLWPVQHMLVNRPPMMTGPDNTFDQKAIELALRSSVQYLLGVGLLKPGRHAGQVTGKTIGRTKFM